MAAAIYDRKSTDQSGVSDESLSLFCPRQGQSRRISRTPRERRRAEVQNNSAKSLMGLDRQKRSASVCKTSIPGSIPGGASNFS